MQLTGDRGPETWMSTEMVEKYFVDSCMAVPGVGRASVGIQGYRPWWWYN